MTWPEYRPLPTRRVLCVTRQTYWGFGQICTYRVLVPVGCGKTTVPRQRWPCHRCRRVPRSTTADASVSSPFVIFELAPRLAIRLCAQLNSTQPSGYECQGTNPKIRRPLPSHADRAGRRPPAPVGAGLLVGRPRTPIGTSGEVSARRRGKSVMAETRFRDADGRLHRVSASAPSAAAARRRLSEKLLTRPGCENRGQLHPSSSFAELADLWLADLEHRYFAEGTRHGYREHFRLDVRPAFEHDTLAEVTTGLVEWFLQAQSSYSTSRGRQSRTLLNLVFAFCTAPQSHRPQPPRGNLAAAESEVHPTTARPGADCRDPRSCGDLAQRAGSAWPQERWPGPRHH